MVPRSGPLSYWMMMVLACWCWCTSSAFFINPLIVQFRAPRTTTASPPLQTPNPPLAATKEASPSPQTRQSTGISDQVGMAGYHGAVVCHHKSMYDAISAFVMSIIPIYDAMKRSTGANNGTPWPLLMTWTPNGLLPWSCWAPNTCYGLTRITSGTAT